MAWREYILALGLIFTPWAAYAEVMDKEPSLLSVWAHALVGIIISFIAAYKSKWIGIATLPVFLFFAGLIQEIRDPFVGPAILREAGNIYVVSAYAAPLLIFVPVIVAFYIKRKKAEKMNFRT